ncbi:hypothetical protein [Belnapia rosea]|nr:hypothetical protein [Belnapia rosea]
MAQSQGVDIETAIRQAVESGAITLEDYEMMGLLLLGGRHPPMA